MAITVNNFAGAAAAYARAHDHLEGAGAVEEPLPAEQSGSSSFADMVRSAMDSAVATGKESERPSLRSVTGPT